MWSVHTAWIAKVSESKKIELYVVINMKSVQETHDSIVWTGFSWLEID